MVKFFAFARATGVQRKEIINLSGWPSFKLYTVAGSSPVGSAT